MSRPLLARNSLANTADTLDRSLEDDWDIHASADVRNLFCDPKAPKAVVRDAYLVQQSNIYVTQVRLSLPRPLLAKTR